MKCLFIKKLAIFSIVLLGLSSVAQSRGVDELLDWYKKCGISEDRIDQAIAGWDSFLQDAITPESCSKTFFLCLPNIGCTSCLNDVMYKWKRFELTCTEYQYDSKRFSKQARLFVFQCIKRACSNHAKVSKRRTQKSHYKYGLSHYEQYARHQATVHEDLQQEVILQENWAFHYEKFRRCLNQIKFPRRIKKCYKLHEKLSKKIDDFSHELEQGTHALEILLHETNKDLLTNRIINILDIYDTYDDPYDVSNEDAREVLEVLKEDDNFLHNLAQQISSLESDEEGEEDFADYSSDCEIDNSDEDKKPYHEDFDGVLPYLQEWCSWLLENQDDFQLSEESSFKDSESDRDDSESDRDDSESDTFEETSQHVMSNNDLDSDEFDEYSAAKSRGARKHAPNKRW